jgi:hypothetical protein
MDVELSDTARDFVRARGGKVFVRAHSHRCCSGAMTLLDVWTEAPKGFSTFSSVHSGDAEVEFSGGPASQPHLLSIDVRGRRRPRLVAYWDGCLFKI